MNLLKDFFFFSQHIMMEGLSLEEENIIKNVKDIYRLKKNLIALHINM